jgi:AraC-like DNA-binding protein
MLLPSFLEDFAAARFVASMNTPHPPGRHNDGDKIMQLHFLTVLAQPGTPAPLRRLILDGRLREAVAFAEELLDPRRRQASLSEDVMSGVAQLCGDLMLALDRAEEAEETYRLAVRLASGGRRGAVRVVSCRTTGLLSLHQQRYGTATACFGRLAADHAATPAQRVEALCAMAVACQGLGQVAGALEALEQTAEITCDSDDGDLAMLVSLVRMELAAAAEIRAHEALQDHVFWRPAMLERPRERAALQPLATIEICLAAHGHHPLVARRIHHWRDLLRASYGDAGMQDALAEHLGWLRATGLSLLELQARIDTALVAISLRQTDFARAVIEPLQGRDRQARRRWSLELAFCQAKLSMLCGRTDEAMQHYQRYALESMQCVRTMLSLGERAPRPLADRPAEVKDDIEMRLPAKYRRAYRYLQAHLDCADLTVREIADDMGVTERALQSAFKAHLGMTPGEIVQRCRVERIRADLLRDDAPGTSVIETAARWGIRNRSTLITSYRKYFRETPSHTLARRGLADAALPA